MPDDLAVQSAGQTIDQEDGADVRVPAILNRRGQPQVYCSLKAETDAERGKLLAALTGRLPKLDTVINQQIAIKNVVVQPVELVSKASGEVVQATRIVLILGDGSMLGCVSEGIRTSLAAIFQLWGPPPWTEPLRFTVKQTDTGDNKRWYSLEYVSGKGNAKPKG